MPVATEDARSLDHEGERFFFCSELCKNAFAWNPGAYVRRAHATDGSEEPVRIIAYFSMEVAADPRMPTYSGGLGVLAGDTLRSFADLRIPAIAVTLAHRKGYFAQSLDGEGRQLERPEGWAPESCLRPLPARVEVLIEGRPVRVRGWRYDVVGLGGWVIPLVLLDTDIAENAEPDRHLTDWLYGGDDRYRLAQEVVLGVGGVRMLRALGHIDIEKLHLNEGHASLAALEIQILRGTQQPPVWDFHDVLRRCVFTTHTPVAAGHDQFGYDLVRSVVGDLVPGDVLRMLGGEDRLNMTRLALNLSGHVNGVARRHREVSQDMFPGYDIGSVTNGVHSVTWTADAFQQLFDRHVPAWREDPTMLRQAASIPLAELLEAHGTAKRRLLDLLRDRTGRTLEAGALTVGFARRATQYKRADLIFSDLGRLRALGRAGKLQLVFAGKAHPRDGAGKDIIQRIVRAGRELGADVPVVYVENYDLELAKAIVSGVDLWLNTPRRPLEASGTSGMKAAHNGVPSLSVLDGWWIEGHVEGVTGWSIGSPSHALGGVTDDPADAEDLYAKLALVLQLFHGDPERWGAIMRMAIALNASFFNTHRMVHQYASSAYFK
jgi:starch phosphorylase